MEVKNILEMKPGVSDQRSTRLSQNEHFEICPPPLFFFYTVQNKLVHLKHAHNRFFSKFYVDGEIEEWNYVDV